MPDDYVGSKLAALLRVLKPKTKEPVSTRVLNTWIAQAEGQLGDEAKGGRLGWLIASSVATLTEVREAAVAVFEARAVEAAKLGQPAGSWPPILVAHAHWGDDYVRASSSSGLGLALDDAVANVNAWIAEIADCR